MTRVVLALAVGWVAATPLSAQVPLDSLAAGAHLRITAPAMRLRTHPNVLDSLRRDTLFLRRFYVPARELERLEIRSGRLPHAEGARRGAKGGARSGAFVGAAILVLGLVSDTQECGVCFSSGTAVGLYALPIFTGTGALGGAVIGGLLPPARWVPVRLQPDSIR